MPPELGPELKLAAARGAACGSSTSGRRRLHTHLCARQNGRLDQDHNWLTWAGHSGPQLGPTPLGPNARRPAVFVSASGPWQGTASSRRLAGAGRPPPPGRGGGCSSLSGRQSSGPARAAATRSASGGAGPSPLLLRLLLAGADRRRLQSACVSLQRIISHFRPRARSLACSPARLLACSPARLLAC